MYPYIVCKCLACGQKHHLYWNPTFGRYPDIWKCFDCKEENMTQFTKEKK